MDNNLRPSSLQCRRCLSERKTRHSQITWTRYPLSSSLSMSRSVLISFKTSMRRVFSCNRKSQLLSRSTTRVSVSYSLPRTDPSVPSATPFHALSSPTGANGSFSKKSLNSCIISFTPMFVASSHLQKPKQTRCYRFTFAWAGATLPDSRNVRGQLWQMSWKTIRQEASCLAGKMHTLCTSRMTSWSNPALSAECTLP